jgi:NAD-dependent SIR2 family protein deacetylase
MARTTTLKTATCTRCKKRRKVEEFYKDKSTKSGHSPWCKTCEREYNRLYRARLKEAGVKKISDADEVGHERAATVAGVAKKQTTRSRTKREEVKA